MYEQALSAYRSAITSHPSYSDAWSGLGSVLIHTGRYKEALEALEMAISLNQQDSGVWYNRGIVLQRLNRLNEAKSSLNEALRLNPNSTQALTSLGEVLIPLNDTFGARESFKRAIDIDPLDGSAYGGLGEVLLLQSDYSLAENVTFRALELYPGNIRAWEVRAEIARARGEEDWAAYYGRTADEIRQYSLNMPQYAKALALHRLFVYDRALDAYDQAIAAYPDEYYIWAGRGDVLKELGRLEDSLQSYDKAVLLNPTDENLRVQQRSVKGMIR